ncbi:hypothetical protein [Streptomyces sp. NPDC055189]
MMPLEEVRESAKQALGHMHGGSPYEDLEVIPKIPSAAPSSNFPTDGIRRPGSNRNGKKTWCLDGATATHVYLTELMRMTERETLSLIPDGSQRGMGSAMADSLARELLAPSVHVKAIYSDQIRRDPDPTLGPQDPARSGAEIRTIPYLAFRVHIADRRVALVQFHEEDFAKAALVTEEPAVVTALCSVFEGMWASATPLAGTGCSHTSITPQEQELLRLLGQGLTDEAAARKLGVSLRTERRMLTKLSDSLNARSRFQLGQRAVERGIL